MLQVLQCGHSHYQQVLRTDTSGLQHCSTAALQGAAGDAGTRGAMEFVLHCNAKQLQTMEVEASLLRPISNFKSKGSCNNLLDTQILSVPMLSSIRD